MANFNPKIDDYMDTHPVCQYFATQTMTCPECGKWDGLRHSSVEVATIGLHIHLTCRRCKKHSILAIMFGRGITYEFWREKIANG